MLKKEPSHKFPTDSDYDALRQPAGRLRAYANLLLSDHGMFRLFYNRPHRLSDEMWRSAQPSPKDLKLLRDRGIRTIINLRGPSPQSFYALEAAKCEKLGLDLVDFRMRSRDLPSREQLHDVRKLLDQIAYPALMHCKSGADRAGLMSALYMMIRKGAPVETALKQLSVRFGHFRHANTGILDFMLERYRDDNRQAPIDFFDWVDTRYDPAALRSEFKAGFWPNLLVDKVLGRE